jgi:hypothetical protein
MSAPRRSAPPGAAKATASCDFRKSMTGWSVRTAWPIGICAVLLLSAGSAAAIAASTPMPRP